ncbi:N-(5'-phosphoribosyl)anthranilate isomerase [Fulvitalea axinellae]|uniref:N-(5'-phosphoribosyl)anthranilate isomerase n=2 Tax=Fulvitalea axinellae TaxID=1182444 RepID=A0AAU9CWQ2_9BACT|nr:N-(5'-phosphoribosyl)anthranilate isomerase [Fulvitalea axinellae]
MRDADNVKSIGESGIDFMGFIFFPKSARYVGEDFDPSIPASLPDSVKRVGVFVNENASKMKNLGEKYGLNYLQLHGNEKPELCAEMQNAGFGVMKAFGVDESFDFETLKDYADFVDYFLLDTKCAGHGGSGKRFDWSLLEKVPSGKPVFLAGGIDHEAAKEIENLPANVAVLDLNSRFEIEPALKDENKLRRFIQRL